MEAMKQLTSNLHKAVYKENIFNQQSNWKSLMKVVITSEATNM